MSLSDKKSGFPDHRIISAEDVKEFIQRIKDRIKSCRDDPTKAFIYEDVEKEIDKEAGEKLI